MRVFRLFRGLALDYERGVIIGKIETLLILLGLVGSLALVSAKLRVPFPIMMVFGGVLVALIPGLRHVSLDPDLVLIVFLPPIIFSAASMFPWHEFRANVRSILTLAIGLVLATMVCVAFAASWWIPGITLAAGFVLGAIVAPPDAVAATAVLGKMRVPQRLITILEGESLVNDSSSLVAYAFAVAAVVSGSFSLEKAALDFVWMSLGGVAFGLLIGWGAARLHERLEEPSIGMTLQLITPYIAYLPADRMGVSGVLSAVAAGLYVGHHSVHVLNAATRTQAAVVWDFLNFILNGAIFILIGLEFPVLMGRLSAIPFWQLLVYGALVSTVVVLVRFAWIFAAGAVLKNFLPKIKSGLPPGNGIKVVASWAGMRGAVSLAAALALPMATAAGEPFPGRDLILFLTYSVIFTTLLLQGSTLPWVVRRCGAEEDKSDYHREAGARKVLLEEAVATVDEVAAIDPPVLSPVAVRILREHFQSRLDHVRLKEEESEESAELGARDVAFVGRLMDRLRRRLEMLRVEEVINDAVWRRAAYEIDGEEQRLRRMLDRLRD